MHKRFHVTLFKVYARALRYLGAYKLRVSLVVVANIVLATITIAEPILFGRIIDVRLIEGYANSLAGEIVVGPYEVAA